MFILGGVASAGVNKRWVLIYSPGVAQLVQIHNVPVLALPIQPLATEGQRTNRRPTYFEERLGRVISDGQHIRLSIHHWFRYIMCPADPTTPWVGAGHPVSLSASVGVY